MQAAESTTVNQKSLADLFKNLIQGVFKRPEITLKRQLFFDLITESAKKHGATDINLPKIELEEGPINLVLGSFNIKDKKILIDSLEIYLLSILQSPVSQKELETTYDEKLTDTIAHEAGHWILDTIKGEYATKEIKNMQLKYFLIFLLPFFFICWGLIKLFVSFFAPIFALGLFSGIVLSIPITLCGLLLVAFSGVVNLVLAGIAAKMITYSKCEHERFARKYADEVKNDPRWREVVTFKR